VSGAQNENVGTAAIAANGRVDRNVRCRHERIAIIETGTWITAHYRDAKEPDGWWHNNEPGGYYTMVDVVCKDCGLDGRYSKRKAPKWLQRFIDELGI
jgi:hypothetical protein